MKSDKLDNEVYENILETLEYNEDKITFPENIPEDKVDILIKLSIIKINSNNLEIIRNYYKNNLNNFIKLNLENYIRIIDTNNNLFSQEELLVILSDKNRCRFKIKVIKIFKSENKNYG